MHLRARHSVASQAALRPRRGFLADVHAPGFVKIGVTVLTVAAVAFLSVGYGNAQSTRPSVTDACPLPPVGVPLFDGTPAETIASTPVVSEEPDPAAFGDEAIGTAVEVIVGCVNTGDPSFTYAVFTPRYLASQFISGSGHYQPAFEQALDAPAAPADTTFVVDSIEAIEPQEDRRVLVTIVLSSGEAMYRDSLLLAYVDGHWLIDEVVALEPVV